MRYYFDETAVRTGRIYLIRMYGLAKAERMIRQMETSLYQRFVDIDTDIDLAVRSNPDREYIHVLMRHLLPLLNEEYMLYSFAYMDDESDTLCWGKHDKLDKLIQESSRDKLISVRFYLPIRPMTTHTNDWVILRLIKYDDYFDLFHRVTMGDSTGKK